MGDEKRVYCGVDSARSNAVSYRLGAFFYAVCAFGLARLQSLCVGNASRSMRRTPLSLPSQRISFR